MRLLTIYVKPAHQLIGWATWQVFINTYGYITWSRDWILVTMVNAFSFDTAVHQTGGILSVLIFFCQCEIVIRYGSTASSNVPHEWKNPSASTIRGWLLLFYRYIPDNWKATIFFFFKLQIYHPELYVIGPILKYQQPCGTITSSKDPHALTKIFCIDNLWHHNTWVCYLRCASLYVLQLMWICQNLKTILIDIPKRELLEMKANLMHAKKSF